jgi:hypothetical protein
MKVLDLVGRPCPKLANRFIQEENCSFEASGLCGREDALVNAQYYSAVVQFEFPQG